MSRMNVPLIALTVAAVIANTGPAAASTLEEFLNAPVWYLEYDVSFKSASQGTYESRDAYEGGGSVTLSFTTNLERDFSGAAVLNLRSGGPGPMTMASLAGTPGGATPSAADAQAISNKMMALMDHTANWMVAGDALDENSADPTAGMMGSTRPARLDYRRVDSGKDLEDETGAKYDWTMTTTIKGTGNVQGGGFGGIMLEMNTAEKSFLLTFPLGFASEDKAKRETVTVTHPKGSSPSEERTSEEVSLDFVPQGLALDEPPAGAPGGGSILLGTLDPATGKISGEQSFKAHYKEGNTTAPGTIVFKYTLTMTPPKK
jgi:hypothetical protein